MSKILVLGVGPLPLSVTQTKLYAPGLRTWHMAQVLARRGHRVAVGVIEFGRLEDAPDTGTGAFIEVISAADGISVHRLRYSPTGIPTALAGLHRAAKFDAVVSTTDIMNYFAAMIPERLPLWLDYNGDPFAEKQLQAAVHGSDASLLEQWRYLAPALLAGDRFSTCSTPQKHALIGQLGLAGRLNQDTAGEELVHVLVPCSTAVRDLDKVSQVRLRGRGMPTDAFIVLWTGGYNTWTDPELLFRGLEAAIRVCPRVHFVSTGGAIEGHDSVTFQKFRSLVNGSDLASHFHFTGWVPLDQIPSYYTQADLALNVDAWSYECELGYRNRITEWIQHGCPVATSTVCEFARELAGREMVFTFDVADPQTLADAIVQAQSDDRLRKERAEGARKYFETAMREQLLYGALLEWAAKPAFARDRSRAFSESAEQKPLSDDLLPYPCPTSALAAHQLNLLEGLRSNAFGQNAAPSPLIDRLIHRVRRIAKDAVRSVRRKV